MEQSAVDMPFADRLGNSSAAASNQAALSHPLPPPGFTADSPQRRRNAEQGDGASNEPRLLKEGSWVVFCLRELFKQNEINESGAESQGDRPNCGIEVIRCRLSMHQCIDPTLLKVSFKEAQLAGELRG
jgi:hypothetical protein